MFGSIGGPELIVMLFAIGSIGAYFMPSIIGNARNKKNLSAIVLLNIFLGWTLIGWVVALVWAVSTERIDVPRATGSVLPAPSVAMPQVAETLPAAALCIHCGKYNLPNARFCSTCGQAMA